MTNAFGGATSDSARVTVTATPGRPVILRHPVGCSVPHLGSFGLSVLAAGDAPLSYQWWTGRSPVEGGTNPILAVAGARKALHQGLYAVQVCRVLSVRNKRALHCLSERSLAAMTQC